MWKGILLAYGRFTGGNTEYNHLPNGARVIVMKEAPVLSPPGFV